MNKKFSLEKEQGIYLLIADGFQQICPYQQPTPQHIPSKIAGMPPTVTFLPKVCSSLCPHFEQKVLNNGGDQIAVDLTCGHGKYISINTPVTEVERDKKGNILTFNK